MKKYAAVFCIALLLAACTGDQIIASIEAALEVTTAAFQLVASAAGLSADQSAVIMQYHQDANGALDQVSQIVSTGGSQAEIAAKITAALSAIVAKEPSLQGLPANVAAIVQKVADELAQILSKYGSKQSLSASSANAAPVKYKDADLQRLAKTQREAVANQAKIKAWLADHAKK